MTKSIVTINKPIVIYKIFVARIVRRIYVNKVNSAFMCFFQKFKACQIIALDKEIHLSAVVYKQVGILRENGQIILEHFVNAFAVFFKSKTVFFAFNIFFNIGNICE